MLRCVKIVDTPGVSPRRVLQSCFVGRKGKTFSMMNHSNSKLMITKSVKFRFVCA